MTASLPLRAALPIAAAALLLGGCSAFSFLPWVDGKSASARKKAEADKPAQLADFAAEVALVPRWSAKAGRGLGRKYLRLTPAIVADRIIAADGYGRISALDRFTGRTLWSAAIGESDDAPFYAFWDRRDASFVTGGVGAGGGRIVVGTTRGDVVALDAGDGRELWRAAVSSEVLARPAASGDLVVAQTADGRLAALEAADGTPRWSFDTQVPLLTLRGTAAPRIAGGLVFAGFSDGNVGAIDSRSGAPIWKQRIMLPQGRTELDRLVDVDGTPVLAGTTLYAASFQGRLKALRASDGTVLWEIEASSHLDLAEGYGHVYLVSDADIVRAIGQSSAAVAWEQEGLRNRDLTSPLAFGNYLLVGDAQGYLHVLAQSDGRFLGRRKIGSGLRTQPVEADGTVYALTDDGRLHALGIERRG